MRRSIASRLQPNTIRLLYVLFALAVLAASSFNAYDILIRYAISNDQCAWHVIPTRPDALKISSITPGGVADKAGIHDGDILLAINGQRFNSGGEAMRIINKVPAGTEATYLIERNGNVSEVRITILKTLNIFYLASVVFGVFFLVVGIVVVLVKPEGKLQRSFARYAIILLLLVAFTQVTGQSFIDQEWWKYLVFVGGFIVAWGYGVNKSVAFYFEFPRPYRSRGVTVTRIILAAWSLLVITTFLMGWVDSEPRSGLERFFRIIAVNTPMYAIMTGFVIFIKSYFSNEMKEKRYPLRHILYSLVVGILALVYVYILSATQPFVLFLNPERLLPAALLVGIPLAFGFSIFRFRLMDVHVVIRKSILYAVVTTAFAAVYLSVVYGVGSLVSALLGESDDTIFGIVAFLIIAFAFNPLKNIVQRSVDRTFYRDRLAYQSALLEFSDEMLRMTGPHAIADALVKTLSGAMHTRGSALVLCHGFEPHITTVGIDERALTHGDTLGGLMDHMRTFRKPYNVDPHEEYPTIDPAEHRLLAGLGIALVIPVILQTKLLGVIMVGSKRSETGFTGEDIDLLRTLAGQAAIALENSRLLMTEIEKQKLEEELSLARRIQEGLLPVKLPRIKNLDVAGTFIPARTVGGDYYDYIRISPTKLLIAIADVSGKGISAALYMSKVQGMIRFASSLAASPRAILLEVNKQLFNSIDRRSYVTITLALFDTKSRTVRLCRAGHNRSIIASNGSVEVIQPKGIGVGLEEGKLFARTLQEKRYRIEKGQTFFFYTDGLTEAKNKDDQEFGEERLKETLGSLNGETAREVIDKIKKDVDRFQGAAEQHDDLTMVAVRVCG